MSARVVPRNARKSRKLREASVMRKDYETVHGIGRGITRVLFLGLLAISACSTHVRTISSGGDTHLELRKVFGRTDGEFAAFTATDAAYMFAPKEVQAEVDAVLAALDASKVEDPSAFRDVHVEKQRSAVTAYAREQVLEIGYPDGTLQIGWRAGRYAYVRFARGKFVYWANFLPSQKTDAAWRSLGSALRRESKGTPLELRGASPFARMRDAYVDYPW
jgi:hypothetical protein